MAQRSQILFAASQFLHDAWEMPTEELIQNVYAFNNLIRMYFIETDETSNESDMTHLL